MPTQTITPPAERNIGHDLYHAVFDKSRDFRIELPYSDALDFIRQIGQYNNFQPDTVIDALDRVDRLIPRRSYGPGNPNNGRRDYTISVGREGSPVIYLERLEFFDKPRLENATTKAIVREMKFIALADESHCNVEEFSALPSRKITFRFWWD